MNDFRDLIDKLNGPAAVGRIIGVTTEHAAAMGRRNSIPAPYWPALVSVSGQDGNPIITMEMLAQLAAARPRGRKAEAA